jgi:zinc transporter ZupT
VPKRPLTPVLFLVTGGLFLVAAARDLFFPMLFSHGNSRPALSASIGAVFLILGMAQRRRLDP